MFLLPVGRAFPECRKRRRGRCDLSRGLADGQICPSPVGCPPVRRSEGSFSLARRDPDRIAWPSARGAACTMGVDPSFRPPTRQIHPILAGHGVVGWAICRSLSKHCAACAWLWCGCLSPKERVWSGPIAWPKHTRHQPSCARHRHVAWHGVKPDLERRICGYVEKPPDKRCNGRKVFARVLLGEVCCRSQDGPCDYITGCWVLLFLNGFVPVAKAFSRSCCSLYWCSVSSHDDHNEHRM